MSRLDEIRKRAEEASEGPWLSTEHKEEFYIGHGIISYCEKRDEQRGPFPVTSLDAGLSEDDARFIAHSRDDIPYLLDLFENLRDAHESKQAKFDSLVLDFEKLQEQMRGLFRLSDEAIAEADKVIT